MKRLLLLSYYYPPAGGAPVQRVLKFSKYLGAFGWSPHVLTVERGAFSSVDPDLAKQIPGDVGVTRTRSLDPFALYARLLGKSTEEAVTVGFASSSSPDWRERAARWVRANVFIPDARIGWVPFAVREGGRLLSTRPFDAVMSSGPPHSVHLAAMRLARRFSLPWLADFRDPWTDIDYLHELPETQMSRMLNRRLETKVLRAADISVTVSPTIRDLLAEKTADSSVEVIYNGFDEAEMADLPGIDRDAFRVAYVGSMNADRKALAFWRAVKSLVESGRTPSLRVVLVGTIDISVMEAIRELGLERLVENTGNVSHRRALEWIARSALTLVVVNRVPSRGQRGILPTKLFEYLGVGRPVVAVGPPGSDIEAVLGACRGGSLFDYEDDTAIAAFVSEWYDRWASGSSGLTKGDRETIAQFGRRESTRRLAALLDGISGTAPVPGGREDQV